VTGLDRTIDAWSEALALSRYQYDAGWIPDAVWRSGSVLTAPASETEIRRAEDRLGTRLPPSYRSFLGRSNGAYASTYLQTLEFNHLAPYERADPPRALLPVQRVAWARQAATFHVDLFATEVFHGPCGRNSSFDGHETGRSGHPTEADYLLGRPHEEVRGGLLQHALRIGAASDVVFLDPLTVDGEGEWQVIAVGNAAVVERFRSFEEFLSETVTMAERHLSAPPAVPGVVGEPALVEVLHGAVDDIEAMLDGRFGDADLASWQRIRAFDLLGVLDDRDGGTRRGDRLARLLGDPVFEHVDLLGPIVRGDIRGPAVPDPAHLLARGRPGDRTALASVSRATISHLPASSGVDLDQERRRRALPPYDSPAAVALVEQLRQWDLHTPITVNPAVPGPLTGVSREAFRAAADQVGVEGPPLVRALLLQGWLDAAIEVVESSHEGDGEELYVLAEADDPAVWAALDGHRSDRGYRPTAALLAAARTSAPALAERSARTIREGSASEADIAWRVLELQQTDSASDALVGLWLDGHYAALRALARRRDRRITADVVRLLGEDDEELRFAGARAARDLRDPATIDALVALLERGGPDDLVVIAGHGLAAMKVRTAAELLRRRSVEVTDPASGALLALWSQQLGR
jgi:hypothetical protein